MQCLGHQWLLVVFLDHGLARAHGSRLSAMAEYSFTIVSSALVLPPLMAVSAVLALHRAAGYGVRFTVAREDRTNLRHPESFYFILLNLSIGGSRLGIWPQHE